MIRDFSFLPAFSTLSVSSSTSFGERGLGKEIRSEVEIPADIDPDDEERISDYLSDLTGFCPFGERGLGKEIRWYWSMPHTECAMHALP